jgi:hypothetical protein
MLSPCFSLCVNKEKEIVKCVDTRLDMESRDVLHERPLSFDFGKSIARQQCKSN